MFVPGLATTSLPSMVQVTKPGFFGGGGLGGPPAGGGGLGGVVLLGPRAGCRLAPAGGLDGSGPIFAAGVSWARPGGGCASPVGFLCRSCSLLDLAADHVDRVEGGDEVRQHLALDHAAATPERMGKPGRADVDLVGPAACRR